MKIECDKCGAKYSIADDKVRGKTFKIRCKKCSNVIIVRDKGAGAEEGGDAPADEPGWHLAIGGETVGPISEAEVRERFAAGEIDKDTSVWQEGFEDWLPLSEVSTFADLVQQAAAAAPRATQPADDPFASTGDDAYSAPASTPSPAAEPVQPVASKPASGPSAQAAPAASSSTPSSPRVSNLTGARNENSVLFSLDSLSSMALGGKPSGPSGPSFSLSGGGGGAASAPSATSNSEGSGLIDIRAMSGMMNAGGGSSGGGGSDDGRDDSMLPSFGGTGFGGLAAAPLLVQPAAQPVVEHVAPEPVQPVASKPASGPS
ncbi:MAG TPA: GYF domain-containing protein, partial [Nannocystis sp.]